ncbi:Uncharacterised protein [Legionella wadsworthii]|uniref:Uncharacterized protein n=1 Tax=Legionella wadsworthii TaxID=28088 RepID=A0A378LMP7_9GAMM|nr:hypothetical protein [Legionella wadsworthii]STY28285.1 Uncharacterised protein [Legionella wadsworthii]
MQERKEGSVSSDIQEMQKKLDYLMAECDLMTKKHENTSICTESTKRIQEMLVSCQNFISNQVSELQKDLEIGQEDIKQEVVERVEKAVVDKVCDVLAEKILNPAEETIQALDGGISEIQNGIKSVTQILDTQDKGFFARTLENTTNFIKRQKDSVMQMHAQFQETGSIKSSFQQLSQSIPAVQEKAKELLLNPGEETVNSAINSVSSTASLLMRYLNDKCDETVDILDKESERIEKSVAHHGGVCGYTKSLVKKVDSFAEQTTERINQLDRLYSFYQNALELGQKVEDSLHASLFSDDSAESNALNKKQSSVDESTVDLLDQELLLRI